YGAAFTPDGTLWTITYSYDSFNAHLATVDLATGAVTQVGSPLWTGDVLMALEADASGAIYGINWSGNLFTLDKVTGQPTFIGFTGLFGAMDLAFDNEGTLWAEDGYGALWTVDTATGAGTFHNYISGLNGMPMGLMVDPSDDTMYATTYTFDSAFYRV